MFKYIESGYFFYEVYNLVWDYWVWFFIIFYELEIIEYVVLFVVIGLSNLRLNSYIEKFWVYVLYIYIYDICFFMFLFLYVVLGIK